MQQARGFGSSYLDDKFQRQDYVGHKKRVKNARRNGFPISLNNSVTIQGENTASQTRLNNANKVLMENQRNEKIERDNTKLLMKMQTLEMSQMSLLDERNMRQSHNLINGKISNMRKNIKQIESENQKLLKRIS